MHLEIVLRSLGKHLPLIQSGADVNGTNPNNKRTPLMMAASTGSVRMAAMLIENGANLNGIEGGTTPLVQVWSLSSLKVSRQVLRRTSGLVRSLAHDFLDGPCQPRAV